MKARHFVYWIAVGSYISTLIAVALNAFVPHLPAANAAAGPLFLVSFSALLASAYPRD